MKELSYTESIKVRDKLIICAKEIYNNSMEEISKTYPESNYKDLLRYFNFCKVEPDPESKKSKISKFYSTLVRKGECESKIFSRGYYISVYEESKSKELTRPNFISGKYKYILPDLSFGDKSDHVSCVLDLDRSRLIISKDSISNVNHEPFGGWELIITIDLKHLNAFMKENKEGEDPLKNRKNAPVPIPYY